MAVVQGTNTTYVDTANIAIDMSPTFEFLDPWETPVLNLIGPNSLPGVVSKKHEWLEGAMRPIDGNLAADAGLDNTTDPVTFTVATGQGEYIVAGDIIQVDSEYLHVTTCVPSTESVTVTRGYGTTTPASHADAAEWKLIGHSVLETADLGTVRNSTKTGLYNYIQTWESPIAITSTEQVIKKYVQQNVYAAAVSEETKAFWKLLNRTLIRGKQVAPTATVAGAMDGIITRISRQTGSGTATVEVTPNASLKRLNFIAVVLYVPNQDAIGR